MAEGADDDDKTEHLSPRRLQQAWDTGKIPIGRELPGVAAMGAVVATVLALGPRLNATLQQLTREALELPPGAGLGELFALTRGFWGLAATILASGALAAVAATLAQTRGGFWAELAMPSLERFSGGRITQALSAKFWADLGISVLKVGLVAAVAAHAVRDDLLTLPRLLFAAPDVQLTALLAPITRLAVRVVALLAVMAGADLALQHLRFRKTLKMTKEEAKREMKEDEGDPLLRSRRRKRARELAKGRASFEVPRADALVVNPTHIAIAIRYRKDEGAAPRVTAKGKGQAAEHMRELARANGIPIVEDIALARLLFKRVKVGRSIPAETFRTVAAILAFVYRLTGRAPQAGGRGGTAPAPRSAA
ncbi:MAG: EscU/YscU/HrcU family type III secretion system export apparatus switch protein [Myxococcaceae bacterium]|nr:EscU/YscU/HrcU family type III secretion system export apparatus switch protein [Myxococcaceae bacterium]